MVTPLAGLRVVDLTRFVSGAYCTCVLAALGADVVKVEGLPGGDPYRGNQGASVGALSALFAALNAGKKSLAVDLRDERGADLVRRLTADSDVFVENSRPGSLRRIGLDFDSLHAVNERLVYASISGYGQVGPNAELGGFDLILQAASGLMSVTGTPEGPPTKVGAPVLDIGAGISTALAILAALMSRAADGRGRQVTSSLLEFAASCFTSYSTQAMTTGASPGRLGNDSPQFAPYGIFRCADGEVAVAGAGSEQMWQRFCAAVEKPEWVECARFATNELRIAHRDELTRLIEATLAHRTSEQWLHVFAAAGVPAESVHSVLDALQSEQARALGLLQQVRSGGVDYLTVRPPFSMDAPLEYPKGAPLLGEDTREVLTELGCTSEQIGTLLGDGVVRTA